MVTLSHSLWCGDLVSDIVSNVRSGVAADSVARRRRVADDVNIVQDRVGPEVVGGRLSFAWGAGL